MFEKLLVELIKEVKEEKYFNAVLFEHVLKNKKLIK